MINLNKICETKAARIVHFTMHIIMLTLSVFLIVSISIDTFRGLRLYDTPRFVMLQTWICVFFMLDFCVEMLFAKRHWHYFWSHIIFFLVSIPYLFIIYRLHLKLSPNVAYLVQYIPLIRGGYALAIVVGWFTYNRVTGLFVTYLVTLLAMVYFGSLAFFMFEEPVNPQVMEYSDALWWACMDTTTVGSNISAITDEGRVISVILAALGMMMFPIFTVYITSIITARRKQHTDILINSALKAVNDKNTDEEKNQNNSDN